MSVVEATELMAASIGVYDKGAGDGVLGMVAYKAKICFMRIT